MVKVLPNDDGRQNILNGNVIVGYAIDETVYAIDADGYAVEIGRAENGASIGAVYLDWLHLKGRR